MSEVRQDPSATLRPTGSTASARVILSERIGIELRSSAERYEAESRSNSAQNDTFDLADTFEIRPERIKHDALYFILLKLIPDSTSSAVDERRCTHGLFALRNKLCKIYRSLAAKYLDSL